MRRAAVGVLVALACAGSPEEPAPPIADDGLPDLEAFDPGVRPPERVVLVTVAGLEPRHYLEGGMPTLARLARAGTAAEWVETVTPASPYPVHTTYLTGRTPREHGVPADRHMGERGPSRKRFEEADAVVGTPLWAPVVGAGGAVASLDWPATAGAGIQALLPDLVPGPDAQQIARLEKTASPSVFQWATSSGVALSRPSAARDALLADGACRFLSAERGARLLLLRFTQTQVALRRDGPGSPGAAAAFAKVDENLDSLLRCLVGAERLSGTVLVVAGDVAYAPVHTVVRPNALLAEAGLLKLEAGGGGSIASWRAILRTSGGSAFLYANETAAAVEARRLLREAAERTGAFRVVGAEEMISLRTDPEAWFGLAASPGFLLAEQPAGALLAPSPARGAPTSLDDEARSPGLVAWGSGIRRELLVPRMRQVDLAPTLAGLLRVRLSEPAGVAFVGMLRGAAPVASPSAPATPGRPEGIESRWKVEVKQ